MTGREGRAWFVHSEKCDLSNDPNWIVAEGYLCRGYKGRIGVLILSFKHESEVTTPPPDEVKKARELLQRLSHKAEDWKDSTVYKIADILKRANNAKGGEVIKGYTADLLTIASPIWITTPESKKELGATVCELGPTTNYRSQRARTLVKWLGAGRYVAGRMTEAGLTAGLEKVEGLGWVRRKGALPSTDLSFLIVDNMPPHALDNQIEARRDGIISVKGIKEVGLWARSWLKLLSNPQTPFEDLVYRCVALKMFDPKLIARFAFAIYTYGIPTEERYNPEISRITDEEKKILDAARTLLRYNLSHEIEYVVPDRFWPAIMEYSKDLEKKYGIEDIPLLLRNVPYKLSILAYSFALLEGFEKPEERHFKLAHSWLDYCARDIELDKYVESRRAVTDLREEEYQAFEKKIVEDMDDYVKVHGGTKEDSYTYRLIEYLMTHGSAQRDELCAYLEIGKTELTEKVNLLKGLGLLKSSKSGYCFTPKGVRFVKRFMSRTRRTERTTLEGQTLLLERSPSDPKKSSDKSDKSAPVDVVKLEGEGICELCGKPGASIKVLFDDGHAEVAHHVCAYESYPKVRDKVHEGSGSFKKNEQPSSAREDNAQPSKEANTEGSDLSDVKTILKDIQESQKNTNLRNEGELSGEASTDSKTEDWGSSIKLDKNEGQGSHQPLIDPLLGFKLMKCPYCDFYVVSEKDMEGHMRWHGRGNSSELGGR